MPGYKRPPLDRWVILDSGWLAAGLYDSGRNTLFLRVRATGKEYSFVGVPVEKWAWMLTAPSPGKFYDAHLRGKYRDAGGKSGTRFRRVAKHVPRRARR